MIAVGGEPQAIDEAVQGYERVWLVVGLDHSIEYQMAQKAQFDTRYELLDETKIGGVHIFVYSLD